MKSWLFSALLFAACHSATAESFPVAITVDASQKIGAWKPVWRFFGADEANYAYMTNGEKLLGELGQLGPAQVYFRCHHLLTSGDGAYALKWGSTSAYKENAQGQPVYDFSIDDRIFDACLQHGVKPYVEIGFMPEALTTHPENYPHNPPRDQRAPADAGQAYPPRDYQKWGDLCYEWTKHCVEKYGKAEVEQWYWEVWNEPNIFYWHGSRQDFFKLYDYAVAGVRRALPTARVGGPETAGGAAGTYLSDFLEHCLRGTNFATGKTGAPLDFISFHAKGSPVFTNDHVRMGMRNQLRDMRGAFTAISHYPKFKNLPIVIGESDPEGCAACRDPQDAYRNGTVYSSYTAASFPRALELARTLGVNLEGALTWAFEFEDQPPFAGFRQVMSDGLDLPVLNVFRMFGKLSGDQLRVSNASGLDAAEILAHGVRGQPDVSAIACIANNKLTVLVWHYHDDDVSGPDADIDLALNALPVANATADVRQFRIDADHSNSYEAWKRLGSPEQIPPEIYPQLEQAGKLAELPPQKLEIKDNQANLKVTLPRQGVALFEITWPR